MKTNENISIQCLPEALQKSIKRIIESECYSTCDVEIRSINTRGANFLGQVLEIDLKGETTNGFKEVNIFLKLKRTDDIIMLSLSDLYRKESFFYNELANIFKDLQDNAKVPLENRLKLPRSFIETSPDAIFLENLSIKGFKTYNRMDTLPLKCIELAIIEIAKLHGLSFAIEYKMPMYHNDHIKVIETPLNCDENFKCLMQSIFAYISDFCDEEMKYKVEKFIPVFFSKYHLYREDKTSTTCALSHGDLKSSNILVRQHNGEPLEVVIVDYQFIDYGCPLRDLFFILTANTDQDIRRNHLNDLKELYYSTLSWYLKFFDMEVKTVYPRNEFDRIFSEWFSYGLMMTISYLPFLYAPDIGIDYSTLNLSDVPLNFDLNTKDKVKKLLQDFIDWGYL